MRRRITASSVRVTFAAALALGACKSEAGYTNAQSPAGVAGPAGTSSGTAGTSPTPSAVPGAADAKTGNAAKAPVGSIVPELVGKWCLMSNIDASDGGRQANTCFTLNPDGTYAYHSDTSSSGPFGGTTSPSDDHGHWLATADTLSSSSITGSVASYRFEKRNHPKTHDPMLVVNGQPFVTYFQKAPW